MSREAMSEEERRRRRNEASRRCYLRRKAELAAQAQPVGAKNKKPKAKAVEAKPARAKPARRGPDPVVAAERLCKTYARVANGVKPMLKDAAEFIGIVYKSEDRRVVEKVERILAKGLGVSFAGTPSDTLEKTRVCLDAVSKAVKTPKFRLSAPEDGAHFVPFPPPAEQPPRSEDEPKPEAENESAEVPVDPALLEKVDAGEADKSEIEIPQDKDDKSDDEDDEDDSDLDEDDEPENEDEDEEDEDEDEDDESEEAQERRARRREREESDNVREYESGRWEMMGEMGAQGAFDD